MPPKLGEFILTKPIGRGAMGQVWLARQESLDRMVAVKILPKEFSSDASFRARFEREAKVAASMIHPNVIQIFSFGIEQNVPYFAMEFVEGEDLSVRIRKGQKFTMRESVKIVADVARALEVAHEKGLVHRDIKPGNIMISKKGIVKVMDFGLAKAAAVQSAISQPGLIMGTPSYMSPEQGMGQELDVRSDIYALGVVLYKLLSGQLPFVADKPTAVIFMHIYENAKPVRSLNPEVPQELASIIEKMMAKKPEERYDDPSKLVADLDAWLSGAMASISAAPVQVPEGVQSTEAISGQAEPTSRTESMVTSDDPTIATTPPPPQTQATEVTESIAQRPAEPTSMPTQAGPGPQAYARTEDAQLEFVEELIQGDDAGVNARAADVLQKSPGVRDRYARQLFIHSLLRSHVDSRDRVGKGRRVMKVLSVLGLQEKPEVGAGAAIRTTPTVVPRARGPMFRYAVIGVIAIGVLAGIMFYMMPAFLPDAEKAIQMVRDKTYDSTDRVYDVTVVAYDTGVKNTLTGNLIVRGPNRWVAILRGGSIILGSNGETGWVNPPMGMHIILEQDRKHLGKFSKLAAELPILSMEEILPKHGWFYFTMIGESPHEKFRDRTLIEVKATSIPGRSGSPIDEGTYWVDKSTGELVVASLSLQPGDYGGAPRSVEILLSGKKEYDASYYHYSYHNIKGKSIYTPSAEPKDRANPDEPRIPGPGGSDSPW